MYSTCSLAIVPSSRCDVILKSFKISPKVVFKDLHIDGSKARINTYLKTMAGVYIIINLINGKIYVGSAITGRMSNRFHKHLFGLSGNKLIAAAVTKYGLANFAFIVADTVPGVVTQEDNKSLLTIENYYIQLLLPDYNVAPEAGNTFGIKHTNDAKLKMKNNYSSQRREQIGSMNRNKRLSQDTVERIRAAALTRSTISPETREKVSNNSIVANLYLVNRIDNSILSDGSINIILRTIPKVAEYCDCNEKTVRRALLGTGIIKKTWRVTIIGKAYNHK